VHAARKQDRRLAAALLAAALAHTPEAEEVLRGARTRMARKPPALARELLRNFPKRRPRGTRRRRKGPRAGETGAAGQPAKSTRPRRSPRGSANGKVKNDVPSDAVLAEALSNEKVQQPGAGGELEPGSGKKLQQNVEVALDRAEDSPSQSGGAGGD